MSRPSSRRPLANAARRVAALAALLALSQGALGSEFAEACKNTLRPMVEPSIGPEQTTLVAPLVCRCIETKMPDAERANYLVISKIVELPIEDPRRYELGELLGKPEDFDRVNERVVDSYVRALITCTDELASDKPEPPELQGKSQPRPGGVAGSSSPNQKSDNVPTTSD